VVGVFVCVELLPLSKKANGLGGVGKEGSCDVVMFCLFFGSFDILILF
jgi:hypothetical protein